MHISIIHTYECVIYYFSFLNVRSSVFLCLPPVDCVFNLSKYDLIVFFFFFEKWFVRSRSSLKKVELYTIFESCSPTPTSYRLYFPNWDFYPIMEFIIYGQACEFDLWFSHSLVYVLLWRYLCLCFSVFALQ